MSGRWNASCSTLFATEQACNWRNIAEFVCIAGGGCFAECEIYLPGVEQRIALNVDVLGEKKHGRDVVDRVILKQYNVRFQNQHNSPSLYSALSLTRSMPSGYGKILLHSLVGNFELVGWEIVISRSSDTEWSRFRCNFFLLNCNIRNGPHPSMAGVEYYAMLSFLTYIYRTCMYLRLWMDG